MRVARDWKTLAADGVDSQFESEQISLRMKRAMVAQAKAGRPHGSGLYGYQRVYRIDERDQRVLDKVIAHPEQAPIVADIVRTDGLQVLPYRRYRLLLAPTTRDG